MSWAGPSGVLAKAWLGKAADDPATKEQLSVFGTTTLGSATRGELQSLMAGVTGKPACRACSPGGGGLPRTRSGPSMTARGEQTPSPQAAAVPMVPSTSLPHVPCCRRA